MSNRYGQTTFISFLGSVLSRLSYFDDNHFLDKYSIIMSRVITSNILSAINSVQPEFRSNVNKPDKTLYLEDLIDNEERVYDGLGLRFTDYLTTGRIYPKPVSSYNPFSAAKFVPEYERVVKKGIDYAAHEMPQHCNMIFGEETGDFDITICNL